MKKATHLTLLFFFLFTLSKILPNNNNSNYTIKDGEILKTIQLKTDRHPIGVTVANSKIIISSSNGDNNNYFDVYDMQGNFISSTQQNTTSQYGYRDLAFDGTYILASDDTTIQKIDPSTFNSVSQIINGEHSPHRGLTYDPNENVIYSSNYRKNILKINAATGKTIKVLNRPSENVYGLAIDYFSNPNYASFWFSEPTSYSNYRLSRADTTFANINYSYDLTAATPDSALNGGLEIINDYPGYEDSVIALIVDQRNYKLFLVDITGTPQTFPASLEMVGEFQGYDAEGIITSGMVQYDKYLYSVNNQKLAIYDISTNPALPTLVKTDTFSQGNRIFLENNYGNNIIVSTKHFGQYGFAAFNLADPLNPVLKSQTSTTNPIIAMEVGSYSYVLEENSNKLLVYYMGTYSSPTLNKSYDLQGNGVCLAKDPGKHLLFVGTSGSVTETGFQVFDCSNPNSLIEKSSMLISNIPQKMALIPSGKTLIVAANSFRGTASLIMSYDYSDPTDVVFNNLAFTSFSNTIWDMQLLNGLIAVTVPNDGNFLTYKWNDESNQFFKGPSIDLEEPIDIISYLRSTSPINIKGNNSILGDTPEDRYFYIPNGYAKGSQVAGSEKTSIVRTKQPPPPPAGKVNLIMNLTPSNAAAHGCSVIPSSGVHQYDKGAGVNLIATDNETEGWYFSKWTGDVSGTNASTNIIMNKDINATANFEELILTVRGNVPESFHIPDAIVDNPKVFNLPITVTASSADDWQLQKISFKAKGTGDELNDISKVEVFLGNSVKYSGNFTVDDGQLNATFSPAITIGAGQNILLNLIYTFKFDPDTYAKDTTKSFSIKSTGIVATPVHFTSGLILGSAKHDFLTFAKCIHIGALTVCGDNISELSTNKYSVSGNVNINDILNFSGDVTVDVNNLSITGNGLISLNNIPVIDQAQLYNGSFSFSVQNALLNGILDKANNLFTMSDLPIELSNIELLSDGVRIEGKLVFPEIMENITAEITTLQITKSKGVDLVGGVQINSVSFPGFKLEDLLFNFNSIDDIFEGGGTLVTRPLSITAGALITQGRLDSIGVWVELSKPIPLGTTGMSLSKGGGYVAGIANPPMKLALGISLVPTFEGSFDIVKLDNLDLLYTFGRSFIGSGDLTVFGEELAHAELKISTGRIAFSGEINIYDILLGNADAAIFSSGGKLNFVGSLTASFQLPNHDGFPFDYISTIVTLPYTFANTHNHFSRGKVWGDVTLPEYFKLSYSIKWLSPGIRTNWATDFILWNSLSKYSSKMDNITLNAQNRFEGKSIIINSNELNKSLKINNSDFVQTFSITNTTPLLVIRLRGANNLPIYSIKLPDGRLVDNNNVGTFSNIEYHKDNVSLKGFYTIQNPQIGKYTLNISNVTTAYLDIFGSNSSPNIIIKDVVDNGSSMLINWDDSDPDDNAKIALYYDDNNSGGDGELIVENINEDDAENSYNWQTDNMPIGSYYIYGVIQDSTNVPVISYYNTPINIANSVAPDAPQNLTYTTADSLITLSWQRPVSGTYNYNVYYSTNGVINYNSASYNLGNTATFNFPNLIPGKIYKFAITSVDNLDHESPLSNIISVNYISATQNNSPVILEQQFPASALTNVELNYQINAFDADSNPISYSIKNAPDGLTISDQGVLSWTPTLQQIGNNLVSFKIDDNNGLQDSASFKIIVLDSLTSTGSIYFSKSYFYSYDENPIVSLRDANLNLSQTNIDSQLVHIYSGIDNTGIDLLLKETNVNSGVFSNSFGITKNSSSNNMLNAASIDSITAVYIDDFPADTLKSTSYFIDSITVDVKDDFITNPQEYQINNAFPNPFNPTTTIQYYLPETANVKLSIFNSLGQLINVLVDEEKSRGSHMVKWNGQNEFGNIVSSGIYFYRFEANGKVGRKILTKKMILLK